MVAKLEYWFDFSCPYAYLASTQVEGAAARTGAELDPRPFLLGGVFNALGQPSNLSATLGAAKAKHNADDMRRFAQLFGVELRVPAGHPLRTVTALRVLLAAGAPFMPLAHRFFRAYWVDGVDLSTEEGVRHVLAGAGLDASVLLTKAQSPAIKAELRARTDEAIARGIFGVPTFFVNGDLFFGQDRLAFVESALGGASAPIAEPWGPGVVSSPVDFYFDYSSPFTYVAAEQVDAMLGPNVRWRPILLGAVFKAIAQHDVPLFAQSEPKRRHTMVDLARQAQKAGAPFEFPSKFPMKTVLPLRMTLAAEASAPRDRVRAFSRRVFRAYWAEGRDISTPEVVSSLACEVGLDGPLLVAAAETPEVKALLRANTDAAVAAGVFGAPTFIVHTETRDALYFGADRLALAARAARGDTRVL